VEHDLVDALLETLLGDRRADLLGARLLVRLLLALFRERLVGDRGQRALLLIVDDLGVDVARAAEHREARTFRGPRDPLAGRPMPLLAALFLETDVDDHLYRPLASLSAATARGASLADLLLDHFFNVFDALALVRLGGAQLAHLRRRLADQIAVRAAQRDAVLVHLGADALGQLEHHRVRIAERHRHGVAG